MEFSYARGLARQMVLAMTAVAAIEIPVAHLLLARWNDAVAVAVTAASVAFVTWVLVDWWAALRRPITLAADVLTVRRGLRAPVAVPLAQISGVRTVPSSGGIDPRALRTVYAGEASVLIELSPGAAEATGRPALAVAVDHPDALVAALTAALRDRAEHAA